jgi:hypothetical protein
MVSTAKKHAGNLMQFRVVGGEIQTRVDQGDWVATGHDDICQFASDELRAIAKALDHAEREKASAQNV